MLSKNIVIIIKHENFLFKLRNHTDNIGSKKITMTNEVI